MSTNNYPDELPDIAALEKLANQFFSALPGSFPAGADGGQLAQKAAPLPDQKNFNFDQPAF